ncbi:MAG: hypothetical protein H5U40_07430 [Polyangiaceae bacterium]|nr:hypothetical protein [Polyangiaceae bacterium]
MRGSSDPRILGLRARYFVASGAGEAGMEALKAALRANRRDGYLRVAMGELCLQAEQYGPAARYFDAAMRLDGVDPREALAGLALAYALDRRRGPAERALDQAGEQSAGEGDARPARSQSATAAIAARELVARGRLELIDDRGPAARRFAARALERSPSQGDALLLDAQLAIEQESITPEKLRRAWLGQPRQPIAAARLALALGPNEEGCALGQAYLMAAPSGRDANAVRELVGRCAASD